MKLTVLLDNNTFIDRYFLGEPGVSYFLEVDGKKILFDVGYSDAFIRNARKLNIDLLDIDFIVLSHGHLDHTWGIAPLIQLYTEGVVEHRKVKFPVLVAHPQAFAHKKYRDLPEIGSFLTAEILSRYFDMQLSREPRQLTEHMLFLGEIERTTDFEGRKPIGQIIKNGKETWDSLLDDSAIVYKSSRGLVLITGCSHSGICNILNYARKVCGDQRVVDVIGGFHLLNPTRKQLQGTIKYLQTIKPDAIHAGHCTDLNSKIEMGKSLALKEMGVGLALEF